jgi:hypothetical protein
MDNKILEFLSEENVRLSAGNRWLVVDEIETCYEITVYEHCYGCHRPTTVYAGFSIDDALEALKGEET